MIMADEDSDEEYEEVEATLKNIIEMRSLKWVFVGGKGGVGKTTSSCSLAIQLAAARENVLLISTDPAHNISDAFGQQFSKDETKVDGFDNLYAMEIDPGRDFEELVELMGPSQSGLLSELASSIPGIDEAMSFAELMRQVQKMQYEVIVFDTAPTGHTLRLLSFPTVLEKGISKILCLKDKFSGLFSQISSAMNAPNASQEQVLTKLEETKLTIEHVNKQFRDPNATTFVCVCIPEFLSLYETERLVEQLSKFEIDSHCIIINQVLFPENGSTCKKCTARVRMQKKYIDKIFQFYEDYNIVTMPLLDEEVRGVEGLRAFSEMLMEPYDPDEERKIKE